MSEYSIPDDSLYTKQDEWVRWDNDRVFVGITDYAQQQLGDIVFVELPAVGATIHIDEEYTPSATDSPLSSRPSQAIVFFNVNA